MCFLGEEGYLKNSKVALDTATYLKKEISQVDGLFVLGEPPASILAFSSKQYNIFAVADMMEEVGWNIERQQLPHCIHMTVMPQHARSAQQFVRDLQQAVDKVKGDPTLASKGSAAVYGMVAKIPSPQLLNEFLTAMLNKVYA